VSVDDFPLPGNPLHAATAAGPVPLPSGIAGVRLWWTTLDRPPGEAERLAELLSSAEVARAARFGNDALRRRWIVGRATLRVLLGRVLDIAPAGVALTRGRRGRPELLPGAAPDFNISHTRSMALVGIGVALPKGTRIGVDVEHRDRVVNADGLARKFMSEAERAQLAAMDPDERRRHFLRLWTCKEAMSKATGDALSAPFRLIDVAAADQLALAGGPPPYAPADWSLHAVAMPHGYLATVALWQRRPPDGMARP
jgi:4'-phosphopantetheinyl transferase